LEFCGEATGIAQKLGLKTKLADLYYLVGLSYWFLGGLKTESLHSYKKGLDVLEDQEDTLQKALLCQQIGRVHVLTGEPEIGLDWVRRSIEIASKLGANWVLSHAYQTLALGLPLKEKDSIINYLEQAFNLAKKYGLDDPSRDVLGRAYDNLSENYSAIRGDYRRSMELLLEGIENAKRAVDLHFQAYLRGALALYAYLPLGEWEKCEKAAHEAIRLGRELGELYLIMPYNSLVFIACAKGELQKATELLNYILPIALKSEWPEFFVRSYLVEAAIRLAQNEFDEAEESLVGAFEYRKRGNTVTQAMMIDIAFGLVNVNLKKGNLEKASEYYQALRQMATVLDEKWAYAYERWAKGLIAEAQGDMDSAVGTLTECVELWKGVQRPYDLAKALMDLARVLQKVGNKQEAEQHFDEAKKISERLGIPSLKS